MRIVKSDVHQGDHTGVADAEEIGDRRAVGADLGIAARVSGLADRFDEKESARQHYRIHHRIAQRGAAIGRQTGHVGDVGDAGQVVACLSLESNRHGFTRPQGLTAVQGRRRGAGKRVGHPHRGAGGELNLHPIHAEKLVDAGVAAVHPETNTGVGGGVRGDVMVVGSRLGTGNVGQVGQRHITGPIVRGHVDDEGVDDFEVVTRFVPIGQGGGHRTGKIGRAMGGRRVQVVRAVEPQATIIDLNQSSAGGTVIVYFRPVVDPVGASRTGVGRVTDGREIFADGVGTEGAGFDRSGDKHGTRNITNRAGHPIGDDNIHLGEDTGVHHADGIGDDLIVGDNQGVRLFINVQGDGRNRDGYFGGHNNGGHVVKYRRLVGDRRVDAQVRIGHRDIERDVPGALRLQHAEEKSAFIERERRDTRVADQINPVQEGGVGDINHFGREHVLHGDATGNRQVRVGHNDRIADALAGIQQPVVVEIAARSKLHVLLGQHGGQRQHRGADVEGGLTRRSDQRIFTPRARNQGAIAGEHLHAGLVAVGIVNLDRLEEKDVGRNVVGAAFIGQRSTVTIVVHIEGGRTGRGGPHRTHVCS